jgi:hypothetical protein
MVDLWYVTGPAISTARELIFSRYHDALGNHGKLCQTCYVAI